MRGRGLCSALLLVLLAACASPFRSEVVRFHQLPVPSNETFSIQARDPAKGGSLEFAQYADLVRERLIAQGFREAPNPQSASLAVALDYGVDDGREKVATRPGLGYGGFGYGGFGYGWGGYPYGPYHHSRWGYYGGFYDPFWGPWSAPEVYSYTVYDSYLDLTIRRTRDGQSVFEGRAEAQTRDDDLTEIVPKLVQSVFTDFPGRSGETVHVKIEEKKRSS